MKEFKKYKIAIIGLGDIAQKAYLPIVANHIKITPIFCTRNTETLTRLASTYHVSETYTNIDELIKSKPDAAMVHTATESHYDILQKLLHAKIPVFVDKPISYSIEECDALLDLAKVQKTLLYVGFNRRFAPLVQQMNKEAKPLQITWQKNRGNSPGDPRVIVFDDFIHAIDSLFFLAKGPIKNLQVRCLKKGTQLQTIQVQWQQNNTLLQGNMNRIGGFSQEHVEFYTEGHTWSMTDFTTGSHFTQERQEILKANAWESSLTKKGFYHLIEDWLSALEEKEFNEARIEDIRTTHYLCEEIVQKVISL